MRETITPIEVHTASWKGIRSERRVATITARTTAPTATARIAHISHAGKYAPAMINEGAPHPQTKNVGPSKTVNRKVSRARGWFVSGSMLFIARILTTYRAFDNAYNMADEDADSRIQDFSITPTRRMNCHECI
jgi:hypothetical protein